MDYRTHRPTYIYFLLNFGVFEWLYLVQYWPEKHRTVEIVPNRKVR